jgi:hypothetical protein
MSAHFIGRAPILDPQASWAERFLARIFVREDIPRYAGALYMRRFHIFSEHSFPFLARLEKRYPRLVKLMKSPLRWGRLYVHCFYLSDSDPFPHCHPWPFVSVVLKGGYVDETWDYLGTGGPQVVAKPVRTAGSICFRGAAHLHRAQLLDETKRTWTLVASGYRGKPWFFHTPTGAIYWKDFTEARDKVNAS